MPAERKNTGQTLGPFLFDEDRPEDPWEILGVSRAASLAEIEDAWRDLRVTADPPRMEQLDRAWRMLNEAPRAEGLAFLPIPASPARAGRDRQDCLSHREKRLAVFDFI